MRSLFNTEKKRICWCMLAVFILSLAVRIYYLTLLEQVIIFPDSVEYLNAAEKISGLRIDSSRVPVYPLFIQLAKSVFPWHGTEAAVIFLQVLLSSVSMSLLFYAACNLFQSITKALISALFMLSNIWLLNWDALILTESLSVFLVTLFLLFFLLFIRNNKGVFLVLVFSVCGLLIFLKPFYLLMAAGLFALIAFKGFRDNAVRQSLIIGTLSITIIYGLVIGYSWLNLKQNGYFGTSDVSAINQMGKILQYRMDVLGDNERIKEYIQRETELQNGEILEPVSFLHKYGLKANNYEEASKFSSSIIKKHPHIFIMETVKFIHNNRMYWWEAFADYNTSNYKNHELGGSLGLLKVMPFINTFGFVFLLMAMEIVRILYQVFIKQKFEWSWIFISIVMVYQIAMSIAGAHGEYPRLIVPVYVLVYLVMFKYVFTAGNIAKRLIRRQGKKFPGLPGSI